MLASYEDLRAQLKANPVPTPDGAFVDHAVVDAFTLQSTCGKMALPGFAETVAALRTSEPTGAQAAISHLPQVTARPMPCSRPCPPADATCGKPAATFYSPRCNDTPFLGGPAEVVAHSGVQGLLFPLYGYYTLNQPCSVRDREALDVPAPDGAGAPPVLMPQSEHEPATAAEGERIAHERFQGSHPGDRDR